MEDLAQMIKEAVEQYGDEDAVSFRNNYSGRGMFGRQCIGLVGDETYCMEVVKQVIKNAHAQGMDFEFDTLVDTLLNYSTDNMGRDIIMYWSSIEPIPEPEVDEEDINEEA